MDHIRNTSQSKLIKSEPQDISCLRHELFKDGNELLNVNAESVYSNISKEYIVFPITRFGKQIYIRAEAGLYFRTGCTSDDTAKVMKCVLKVSECKRLNDEIFCLVKPITNEQSVKVSPTSISEDEEFKSSDFGDAGNMGNIPDITYPLTSAINIVNAKCDKDLDLNKFNIDSLNASVNNVDKEIHVNLNIVKTENEEKVKKVRTKRKTKRSFERRKCSKSSKEELNKHKNVHNDNCECNDCGRIFQNMKGLLEHQTKTHANLYPQESDLTEKLIIDKDIRKKWSSSRTKKNSPVTCEYCNREFPSEGFLKRHITVNHENEYKCNVCDKVCRNKSALRKHTKTHTKSFGCGICSKSFAGKRSLDKHMKVHSDSTKELDKGTICQVCGKYISCKRHLKIHMRIHTGEKPYQCDKCEEAFSRVGQLRIHLNKHSGIQPHLCPTCGASFYNSAALYTHKIIKHTADSDKRFSCSSCDKKFPLKDHLMRHEKVHTGVKPFKCEFCTMSFSQSGNLKTHLRTHTQEKPFSCTECNASFSHRVSLKTHMSKHRVAAPLIVTKTLNHQHDVVGTSKSRDNVNQQDVFGNRHQQQQDASHDLNLDAFSSTAFSFLENS